MKLISKNADLSRLGYCTEQFNNTCKQKIIQKTIS